MDDGIATGSTVLAALRGLSALGVKRRAVATPLAAREALERVGPEVEWVAAAVVPERSARSAPTTRASRRCPTRS